MGGLTKRSGAQTEIKYRYILEGLIEMGYQAVGIGANELKLSIDALAQVFINVPSENSPMLSANLGVYGFDAAKDMGVERYRIVEAGGKKIGVTSVLGAKHALAAKSLQDSELVEFVPPAEALAVVAPRLAAENCDLQVLMVHGDPREAAELSQQFPQFQIVAAAGGAEEPPSRPATIDGSAAALIETGHKGMYVAVLAIFDDAAQPYRYQRVPLDARFADSPQMQAKLVAYQKELETMTLAGLGLTGVVHPDGDFAGSEVCADCHTSAWEVFENSPHYHATDTLVNLVPPRHFDPECLSCHVTGWNPQ
jgi:2',3'-cyclic-nucleotide 2'-phosphodiesterase (5'-nucleotidase family)